MATKKQPLDGVTVKPAVKDSSGMTATDRVIAANKAANPQQTQMQNTASSMAAGTKTRIDLPNGDYKTQETIPGTNTIKEYNSKGQLIYIGGNDPTTRQQVEAYNQSMNKTTPSPTVTPEQLAQIGQSNPVPGFPNLTNSAIENMAFNNDPITQDIIDKQMQRQQVHKNLPLTITQQGLQFTGYIPIIGPYAENQLKNYKTSREFYQDYSQESNFKAIKDNIGLANRKISKAIVDANKPGDLIASQNAITDFNDALQQLRISERQLKQIADNDQRAYVEEIRSEQAKLSKYLESNIPTLERIFASSLAKPNPGYYDASVSQLMGDYNSGN